MRRISGRLGVDVRGGTSEPSQRAFRCRVFDAPFGHESKHEGLGLRTVFHGIVRKEGADADGVVVDDFHPLSSGLSN